MERSLFFNFNAIIYQKCTILFLKTNNFMMFFLISYIIHYHLLVMRARASSTLGFTRHCAAPHCMRGYGELLPLGAYECGLIKALHPNYLQK